MLLMSHIQQWAHVTVSTVYLGMKDWRYRWHAIVMHIQYIGVGLIDEDIINIKIKQKNINLTKEDEERK